MKRESDRRWIVGVSGILAAIAASMHRIAAALRISEASIFTTVVLCELILVARMAVVGRRACRNTKLQQP